MTDDTKPSPWILEADEKTFQQDVVERSRDVLMLIDFWAPWCQPCQLLGPILEKLARDYDGKFLLVKANTEKMPNIAAAFGVESIPAVFALGEGKLVDFFVGLKREAQLRAWIDRLLPSPAQQLVSEARLLEATDPAAAEAKYLEASQLDANLPSAKIGLAALLLKTGRHDETQTILDELERRGFLEPEAERVKAELHLKASGTGTVDVQPLRQAVAADPKDFAARLALAEALGQQGQYEEALELALAAVSSGKKDFVEPARKLMVDIFHLLPDDSELVTTYRRRLSTALV
jgi:putative thioredoxin